MTNSKYLKVYTDFLEKSADVRKPLKVVLDCSNGPAGLVLKKLKILNTRFYILNSNVDGRFPAHGPNPLTRGATDQLVKEVLRQRAGLGAVFDGDADRVVFIDNLGKVVPVYAIILLLSLKTKPPYVADVYVAKTLKHLNLLNASASRVGTYYIKKTMKRVRASLGAELSGHYYFKEMKNADSAVLAVIKVMNALSELPYKMSEFTDLLPEFYFEQWNVRTKNPKKLMNKIRPHSGKNTVFIVRPSNTEPLVRFFVGSKDKRVLQRELKKLKALLP